MFNVKEWFERKQNIVRKTAGLEEKSEATQRKMQVAMRILDRREVEVPVQVERRRELYDYHQKLA